MSHVPHKTSEGFSTCRLLLIEMSAASEGGRKIPFMQPYSRGAFKQFYKRGAFKLFYKRGAFMQPYKREAFIQS